MFLLIIHATACVTMSDTFYHDFHILMFVQLLAKLQRKYRVSNANSFLLILFGETVTDLAEAHLATYSKST